MVGIGIMRMPTFVLPPNVAIEENGFISFRDGVPLRENENRFTKINRVRVCYLISTKPCIGMLPTTTLGRTEAKMLQRTSS